LKFNDGGAPVAAIPPGNDEMCAHGAQGEQASQRCVTTARRLIQHHPGPDSQLIRYFAWSGKYDVYQLRLPGEQAELQHVSLKLT
jgi:hypothetical protein